MTKLSKRPVVLIPSLRAGGGAERQVEILANAGIFSKVITLENINEFDIDPSLVHSLTSHTREQSRLYLTLYIPIYAWKLSSYLKKERHEIVFSVMQRADFVNIIANIFFKHKAITNTQVHVFTFYRSKTGRLYLKLMQWLFPYADVITSNSAATLNDLVQNFSLQDKPKYVLPNFYDLSVIRERAEISILAEYDLLFQGRTLLCVGRLTAQKCHWYTLMIFSELKKKHPDITLIVLNDGDLRSECIRYSRELGLSTVSSFDKNEILPGSDVYFLGIQKNPYQFFARCTLSIHPSICEGLPNALIEARASSAFCVSSDCPSGPREILAPESSITTVTTDFEVLEEGVLVQPFKNGEPDWSMRKAITSAESSWVAALDVCLSNSDLVESIRKNSVERIERYDISRIDDHIEFLGTTSTQT